MLAQPVCYRKSGIVVIRSEGDLIIMDDSVDSQRNTDDSERCFGKSFNTGIDNVYKSTDYIIAAVVVRELLKAAVIAG